MWRGLLRAPWGSASIHDRLARCMSATVGLCASSLAHLTPYTGLLPRAMAIIRPAHFAGMHAKHGTRCACTHNHFYYRRPHHPRHGTPTPACCHMRRPPSFATAGWYAHTQHKNAHPTSPACTVCGAPGAARPPRELSHRAAPLAALRRVQRRIRQHRRISQRMCYNAACIVCGALFVNTPTQVCRHHAAAVARDEGQCSQFECPYHGWTYGMLLKHFCICNHVCHRVGRSAAQGNPAAGHRRV